MQGCVGMEREQGRDHRELREGACGRMGWGRAGEGPACPALDNWRALDSFQGLKGRRTAMLVGDFMVPLCG